jgi:hypothetical protein
MPTPATIAITPGAGQLLDAVSVVIGPNTVVRETMVIADPSNASQLALVTVAGALTVTDPVLDGCITANVLAVSLPTSQITTLTPPSASAIAAAIVANPPQISFSTPQHVVVDSGTITSNQGGVWTIAISAGQVVAVTNAGTFAVQDAAAESSLATLAGTVSGGAVTVTGTVSASNPSVGTDGAAAPASSTQIGSQDGTGKLQAASSTNPLPVAIVGSGASIGAIDFAQDTARFLVAQVNIGATGVVIAGVSGKVIRIYRVVLVVGGTAPGFVEFDDTTPAVLFPASPFLPYSSLTFDLDAEPYFTTGVGKGFTITLTTVSALTGVIYYTQT